MEEVKDYPPYLDHPRKAKQVTNVDRIRALSDEELAKVFSYCARLSSLVAPAQAKMYYGFTFDGAVTDTLYGLAMLYANELCGGSTIESFKQDELYGPVFERMMSEIDRVLNGDLLVGHGDRWEVK